MLDTNMVNTIFPIWIATCLKTKPFFSNTNVQSFKCATRRDILMISTNLDFGVVHHNKNEVQNI
jgi:hypothetical protein